MLLMRLLKVKKKLVRNKFYFFFYNYQILYSISTTHNINFTRVLFQFPEPPPRPHNELKDLQDRITANLNAKYFNSYHQRPPINKNYGRIYANHHFGNDLNAKDDTKYQISKSKTDNKHLPDSENFMSKFSHHRDATQAVAQNDEHVEHENEKETTADKKLDGPEFTYNLPALGSHQIRDKEPPFAVGPNDPRYYGEEVHNSKVGGTGKFRVFSLVAYQIFFTITIFY